MLVKVFHVIKLNVFIAILRGINVGGHRKILMADLKSMLIKARYSNPQTYIQSGNVAFRSENLDLKDIEFNINTLIKSTFNYDVPVIVRTKKDILKVIVNNPYLESVEDTKKLHISFLSNFPNQIDIDRISNTDFGTDKFQIIGKEIHVFVDGSYHKTKISNTFFEKHLKVSATTRNWKTVNKLIEIAEK